MQYYKEKSYVHPLAKKEFREDPHYKQFVSLVKESWDNLRPGDRDKQGERIKGTSYSHFKDIYNEKELKDDGMKVAAKKNSEVFEGKTPLGEIGEYLIMEGIYNLSWLAEGVEVIPTHEFDDYERGTDLVLRFEDENGTNFYLGVDVTTSQSPATIKDKRQNILNALRAGELTNLKYFEDADSKLRGETNPIKGKKLMPGVAIVLNPKDAERMLYIILSMKKRENLSQREIDNLIPEEKQLIKEDEIELKFVQEAVEREFIGQIEENMRITKIILDSHIEVEKKMGGKELLKNYEKAYRAYKKIFEKIKKEA